MSLRLMPRRMLVLLVFYHIRRHYPIGRFRGMSPGKWAGHGQFPRVRCPCFIPASPMMDPASLRPFLTTTLEKTDFHDLGEKYAGKVRDVYLQKRERRRILIATDRQSAFDINWCTIPLKGQVLNQVSAWWFRRIADLMPNHVLNTPDPNVTSVKDLRIGPIQIVLRVFLTGSSKTAAWTNYKAGIRQFCGNVLTDGMVKNQPFPKPIITPTTKAADDEMIDPED